MESLCILHRNHVEYVAWYGMEDYLLISELFSCSDDYHQTVVADDSCHQYPISFA